MPRRCHHFLQLLVAAGALSSAISGGACIGVSEKHAVNGAGAAGAGAGSASAAELKVCRAGTRPAADGIIDDFEDTNNQLTLEGGRDGYWWPKKDDFGTTLEAPDPFGPSEGAGDGSDLAMHISGTTSNADGAWGSGFGVDFLSEKAKFYDASKYAGIAFKAKVGEKSTRRVRFKIGDINTHPDGNVCKDKGCWNHFGKDLNLTPQWKEYKVLFTEAQQEAGWGDPRPAVVTPSKLRAIDWSIGPGQVYDVWVDDVYFLDCK